LPALDSESSQWETDKESNLNTCDYKITVKHRFDATVEMPLEVYPFAPSKKLYQVNGEYVKASCGGRHILETWDGKKDNECLLIDNPQEEKVKVKEEMPNHLFFYLNAQVIPTWSGFLVSHDCVPDGGCLDTNLPPFASCPNAWEQAAN